MIVCSGCFLWAWRAGAAPCVLRTRHQPASTPAPAPAHQLIHHQRTSSPAPQEQLKAEFNKQEKKKKDAANAVERNRIKIQEHENKIRGNLLAAFSKEDQERLERNARRRLGEKE